MFIKGMEHKMKFCCLLTNESYLKLKTNSERIEFVLKTYGSLTSLRQCVYRRARVYTDIHSKKKSRSIYFKNEAMNYFQSGEYQKAVDLFTKAILSSPLYSNDDSMIHLSQSFALKSLAQFQLNDFLGALMSAIHSMKFYETIEMLLQRIRCLKHLGRFEESLQFMNQLIEKYGKRIKFSVTSIEELNGLKMDINQQKSRNDTKSDLKVENISNSMENIKDQIREYDLWIHPNLKLVVSEKKGRHILATDFIPKETTILMENPISVLIIEEKNTTCHYCYKTGLSSVWPCIGCDEVVYCDEDCSLKAYEEYHHIFCGFVKLFNSINHSFRHAFELISKVGVEKVIEFHQKKKCFDFIEFFEKKRRTEGNSENQMETTLDFESLFLAFYSLAENYSTEEVSYIDNIFQSIEVALLLEWKQQIYFDEQEIERFITLVEIIFKCSNKVSVNAFRWSHFTDDRFKIEKKRLGNCVMNFGSLFNHSCEPNIFWDFFGTKYMITTTKDINCGQELCISYGPDYKIETFIERQKKLKVNYFFDCDCKACLRDVKTFLCLRCEHCTGPVPVIDIICYFKRDNRCLKCGHKFEEAKETMDILKAIVEQFNNSLKSVVNNTIEESLQSATLLLIRLRQLAYYKSFGICLKQLIESYVSHKFFIESVQWLEWFITEIDLNYDDIQSVDSLSENILEELNVWTNCYYELFLNKRNAMSEHQWSNCFYFYSKLITILQMLLDSENSEEFHLRLGSFSTKILSLFVDKQNEFMEMRLYLMEEFFY